MGYGYWVVLKIKYNLLACNNLGRIQGDITQVVFLYCNKLYSKKATELSGYFSNLKHKQIQSTLYIDPVSDLLLQATLSN